MQNFMSLRLNAGAQITNGGRAKKRQYVHFKCPESLKAEQMFEVSGAILMRWAPVWISYPFVNLSGQQGPHFKNKLM